MTPLVSIALLRTQSDARLAALAAQGHERAFEAIVERYRRPLHRFCRRVLPEPRAEDAVQHTFLKAWTALSCGTEVADLRAWLYRIARNAALDGVRKAGYDYDELTDSLRLAPGVDEDLERRAIIRETLTGVAALPDNQREALLRTAVDGHSRAEIARDLRVTEGAVRQLVHRARMTLRAAATAITPLPFASWAAAFGGSPDTGIPQRIAEVAAGAGSAGGTGVLLKTGTAVVAAGVLAVGPPGTALRSAVMPASGAPDANAAPAHGDDGGTDGNGQGRGNGERGSDSRRGHGRGAGGEHGRSARERRAGDDGGGSAESRRGVAGDDRSGSGDDHREGTSGSGISGSGTSVSGDDRTASGSGFPELGDGTSGSGSSGSGESGTGSSGSGGDALVSGTSTSGEGATSSGSGSSGSDDPLRIDSSGPGPGP